MSKTPIRPGRSAKGSPVQDPNKVAVEGYNEACGAHKYMEVHPACSKVVVADEIVGAGKLVKLSAAGPYSLKCLGRAYDPAKKYMFGDIAVNAGKVYISNADNVTGAFDAAKWIAKADAVVAGIVAAAGDVVSTGRWHNAISVAGHLVDDDTIISWASQRN